MISLTAFLDGEKTASMDSMLAAYATAEKIAGVPGMVGSVVDHAGSLGSSMHAASAALKEGVEKTVGSGTATLGQKVQHGLGRAGMAIGSAAATNPGIAAGATLAAGTAGAGFAAGRMTAPRRQPYRQ